MGLVRKENSSVGDRIPEAYKMSDAETPVEVFPFALWELLVLIKFSVFAILSFFSLWLVFLCSHQSATLCMGPSRSFTFWPLVPDFFLSGGKGGSLCLRPISATFHQGPGLLAAAFTFWVQISDTGCQ